jgi:hypothetical protein
MWQGSCLFAALQFFAGMRLNTLTFIDVVYDTHVTWAASELVKRASIVSPERA